MEEGSVTSAAGCLTFPSLQGVAASSVELELDVVVVVEKGRCDMRRPLIKHTAADHVRACQNISLSLSYVLFFITTCTNISVNFYSVPLIYTCCFVVIRPPLSHPHTRGLRKSDPVTKYHEFRQIWETHKAPGEKSRNNLRWHIRVSKQVA